MISVSTSERYHTVPRQGCSTQLLPTLAGLRQAPPRAFGNQQLHSLPQGAGDAPGEQPSSGLPATATHTGPPEQGTVVPTPEGAGLPGTADTQMLCMTDAGGGPDPTGAAVGQRMLLASRSHSRGRGWRSGVRAVLPGPAASAGLPGSAGLLSIVPAASSEPSPEHKLPGRCRGEVGWRGAGSFNGGCAEPHRPPAAGQQQRHARSPASGITSGAGGWSGHRSGAFGEINRETQG